MRRGGIVGGGGWGVGTRMERTRGTKRRDETEANQNLQVEVGNRARRNN